MVSMRVGQDNSVQASDSLVRKDLQDLFRAGLLSGVDQIGAFSAAQQQRVRFPNIDGVQRQRRRTGSFLPGLFRGDRAGEEQQSRQ